MSTLAQLLTAAPSAQILTDGYRLRVGDSGVEGNIRFWVSGNDVANFRGVVAGLPATTVSIGGTGQSRMIPLLHPYEFNCYANSLDAYPAPDSRAALDSGGTSGISFADWFVDVGFATPKFDYSGGTYPTVTISRQTGVDMVTRPGSAYKFPSDGLRINHDVGVPVITCEYALTFHRLTSINDSTYDSLAGAVNNATFFGKPAGTMLYRGASSTGELTLGGIPSYEVTHQFGYRSVPHNQIMRPDGTGFEAPVQVAGSGTNYMLRVADLSPLYAG